MIVIPRSTTPLTRQRGQGGGPLTRTRPLPALAPRVHPHMIPLSPVESRESGPAMHGLLKLAPAPGAPLLGEAIVLRGRGARTSWRYPFSLRRPDASSVSSALCETRSPQLQMSSSVLILRKYEGDRTT